MSEKLGIARMFERTNIRPRKHRSSYLSTIDETYKCPEKKSPVYFPGFEGLYFCPPGIGRGHRRRGIFLIHKRDPPFTHEFDIMVLRKTQ